jgi:HSP20 family protein
MTLVRRTSPLGELVSLRQAVDRLFEDSFARPRGWGFLAEFGGTLPLDVTNTPEALLVEAALPGIRPEDVEITVENGTLSIRAESTDEREKTQGESIVKEIRRGSMSRTVTLPTGLEADKATATFENGVLRLTFPRAEAVKPRQIRISPTIDGQSSDGSTGEAVVESTGADTTDATRS